MRAALASSDDLTEVSAALARFVHGRVPLGERDEVVQETLTRLLEHPRGLPADALVPYAVVIGRNLVIQWARRTEIERRFAPRLREFRVPDDPADRVVGSEEQRAMRVAVAALSPGEREAVMALEVDGETLGDLGRQTRSTTGAVAVSLAAIRGRLRVSFLLSHRGVRPSDRCRSVLEGLRDDLRRQRRTQSLEHLALCASVRCSPSVTPTSTAYSVNSGTSTLRCMYRFVPERGNTGRLVSYTAPVLTGAGASSPATARRFVAQTLSPGRTGAARTLPCSV